MPSTLMDTLMAEHGVSYGQTVTRIERPEHHSSSDGADVPPNHTSSGLTAIALMNVKYLLVG